MSLEAYIGRLALPECAMKINGEYLEVVIDGYRTSSVSGRDGSVSNINEQSLGEAGRTIYLSKKEMPKDIVVNFQLTADSREGYKTKHDLLKTKLRSPNTKFYFDDDSGAYYIGTVSSINMTEANTAGMDIVSSSGEIVIRCSDPSKYSGTDKTFTAVEIEGVLQMTIVNDGSKAVPIDFRITNNDDNGFFGIISNKGIIQLGKTEEVDGTMVNESEQLATLESFYALPDDHGINYAHTDEAMTGTLDHEIFNDVATFYLKTLGTEEAGKWNGGMRTLTLPADSEGVFGAVNFYCYTNHWFETALIQQTGVQSIAFLTDTNEVICGICMYKADPNANKAIMEYRVNGKVVRTIEFVPSMYDADNPFNFERGHNDVRKEGEKITFYWFGTYPSFVDPAIAAMACTKIQMSFANFYGRGLTTNYLGGNRIKTINYSKMNISKWQDSSNRYKTGDVITIDGSEAKIYVNGMSRGADEIKGSKYFLAEPGETLVAFVYSSFCTIAPSITATIEEVWT